MQFIRGHTGEGWVGGKARPSISEIESALKTPGTRLPGQNAVQFIKGDVRVIVNEDMPMRSTAVYDH